MLKKEQDLYFIIDYYPQNRYSDDLLSSEQRDLRNRIWKYKNGLADAVSYFTPKIKKALIDLIDNEITHQNIGLVAVPRSKSWKRNSIADSIEIIVDEYRNENALHGVRLYNYSNLLKRIKDVESNHTTDSRLSFYEQYNTIGCESTDLIKDDISYILIDDIATTGMTLDVCKKILIDNCIAYQNNIYKLVIAKTVSEYE